MTKCRINRLVLTITLFSLVAPCRGALGGEQNGAAGAYLKIGVEEAERGNMSCAEAAFRAALDADPTSAEAATRLGELLFRKGNYDEALAVFSSVIEAGEYTSGEQPDLFLWAGMAASEADKPGEAIKYLKPLTDDAERGTRANALLGVAYSTLGKEKKAVDYLSRASSGRDEWSRLSAGALANLRRAGRALWSFSVLAGYDSNLQAFVEGELPEASESGVVSSALTFRTPLTGKRKVGLEASIVYVYYPKSEPNSLFSASPAILAALPHSRFKLVYSFESEDCGSQRQSVYGILASPRNVHVAGESWPAWSAEVGDTSYVPDEISDADHLWWQVSRAFRFPSAPAAFQLSFKQTYADDEALSYWEVLLKQTTQLGKGLRGILEIGPRRYPDSEDGIRKDVFFGLELGYEKRRPGRLCYEAAFRYELNFSNDEEQTYERFVFWAGLIFDW